MIVRIATEGQYRLSSALLDQLNEMDNALVAEIAQCNEAEFTPKFHAMLDFVREKGTKLAAEELLESHVILPRPDITLAEALELFVGEGVIPG